MLMDFMNVNVILWIMLMDFMDKAKHNSRDDHFLKMYSPFCK